MTNSKYILVWAEREPVSLRTRWQYVLDVRQLGVLSKGVLPHLYLVVTPNSEQPALAHGERARRAWRVVVLQWIRPKLPDVPYSDGAIETRRSHVPSSV